MIATFNPEEGELREHLFDRFAMALSSDAKPLTVSERIMGVENVLGFSAGTQRQSTDEAEQRLHKADVDEQGLRSRVEFARMRMPKVKISQVQIRYLCEEATWAGCEGQRAEIFATEIAKASAALDGREEVNANDLQAAVMLAILPRATVFPGEMLDGETGPPDSSLPAQPPPPATQPTPITEPPPIDTSKDEHAEDEETEEEKSSADVEEEESQNEDDEEQQKPDETLIPEEFMFGVERVRVDPKLLKVSRPKGCM